MEILISRHQDIIRNADLSFQKSIIDELPWDEQLLGIKGSRGVGKTTLMIQYIKKSYGMSSKALYISLDDLYFTNHRLIDFVKTFVQNGGEHLFIDEVHKYDNWSVELKNIYDIYSKLRVVFTGSSLLEILNARSDLSRRALVYDTQGLSYREYLELFHNIKLGQVSLQDILNNHLEISASVKDKMNPLELFSNYLRVGYFPFYNNNSATYNVENQYDGRMRYNNGTHFNNEIRYHKRLQEIINMIVEVELPMLRNTDPSIIPKIKKLIYIVSQSVPYKPNISNLSSLVESSRKTLLEYIHYLSDANVFKSLLKSAHGNSLLQKPDKLFLENTNFMYAINHDGPVIGNVRETFFFNQVSYRHQVTYPHVGDFLVDDKYIFEIGGKSKSNKQIAKEENAYVVADDIEFGFGNKIPLWLFGLLY